MTGPLHDQTVLVVGRGSGLASARPAAKLLTWTGTQSGGRSTPR